MAPPHKKRRISSPVVESLSSRSELSVIEPNPGFAHSVEQIEHKPQHIQEIHLQIQERPVAAALRKTHQQLHRRQASGYTTVESVIETIDSLGVTILSTVTNVLPATTPLSTTPSISSDSTFEGRSSSTTGETSLGPTDETTGETLDQTPSTSSSNSNSTSDQSTTSQTKTDQSNTSRTGSPSESTGSPSPNFTNGNGNSTIESTGRRTTERISDRTSSRTATVLATLSNGDTTTFTRSNKPYTTTLRNGDILTVCPTAGECRETTRETRESQNSQRARETTATSLTSSLQPISTTSAPFIGGGGVGQGSPTSPATSTSSPTHNSNSDDSTPPPGTIAGGVVGGAAGLAIILLIALVALRWYKRKSQQGHHALPPSSAVSPEHDTLSSPRGPGMAERAGLAPFVSAVPGFFRHSTRSTDEPAPSERGFTRVSGRKLPSQFSEGMSSGDGSRAPPSMPLTGTERNLSSTSFYRDSNGFYGGEGTPAELSGSPIGGGSPPGELVLSPGPQRTPTVHAGGPYLISPSSSTPATPRLPMIPGSPPGTAVTSPMHARSETPSSIPDNRSSRFTEEV
ncbi:hypothetical protein LTR37_012931 [Vermiconidia calcicola]|uniref:Uncharacterized protein n=1 Tax=Vermiconidia calcicola TaxID=1690605 RepID=A0ACC3MXU6_9PEZI|nr:hypothetical protein LTR37_012931 [Vermiconidia calcicola]